MAFVSKETRKAEFLSTMKSFFKSAAVGLIIIVLAIGVLIAGNILRSGWTKTVNEKATNVNQLRSQLNQSRAKYDQLTTLNRNLYTGVDMSRVTADSEIVEEIFRTGLNWSGLSGARTAFSAIADRYSFNREYYETVFGVSWYRDLNEGLKVLSCTFRSFKAYAVSIVNETYYYRAVVSFSKMMKDGSKAEVYRLATYTVDANHQMGECSCEPIIK
jgi:hypothetical protein